MIKLKQTNMLCNKCVLHVLQVLTRIEGIHELEVDLKKKLIKIILADESITKDMITTMVNNAIEGCNPRRITVNNF